MRIDVAYCIELGREVDIQEACQEFAAQDHFTEFHFLCSDPTCRSSDKDHGVRVTAVNHHRLPEEGKVFKSPHFRKWDDHIATCEWMELDAALRDGKLLEEVKESEKHRKIRNKVTKLITRFILPSNEPKEGTGSRAGSELERIRGIADRQAKQRGMLGYLRGAGSTATSLEALVTCYEELKSLDALDEEFEVDKYGSTTFRNAFRQLVLGEGMGFFVLYGGARLYKRYGTGFALDFMDKIHEKSADKVHEVPVTLYISSDDLKTYRPSARLRRMVDEVEKNKKRRPYLRVYWIGKLERTDKGYKAAFTSLAHVVMRLVYPAEKPAPLVPAPESHG